MDMHQYHSDYADASGLQAFVDRDANFRGLSEVITAIEQMQYGKANNGKLVIELI
jgi:hypothetical protein